MKNNILNISLLIVSLIFALLLAEGAAQIYVYEIAKQGKLFKTDEMTGWAVKPHLDVQRKNADGNFWTVRTDKDGFRRHRYSGSGSKVLVLGDSFAFGEGVDVEDRFDSLFINQGYAVINTGVMGYGTDQQFLKAKPYLAHLIKDDVVIMLTYYNDFYDIALKQNAGRAKPWFTLKNGDLQLHKPQIALIDWLRDKSYIYARLGSLLEKRHDVSGFDIDCTSKIYQKIVEEIAQQITKKGARMILAYHGISVIKEAEHRQTILQTLNNICDSAFVECLNVDKHFSVKKDSNHFLADGHWNKKGHEAAGSILVEKLSIN